MALWENGPGASHPPVRFVQMDEMLFYRLGVALVIGLLIGLQREYAFRHRPERETDELLAGARTFPIIALLGSISALVADRYTAAIVFAGTVVALAALLVVAHHRRSQHVETGLTTEAAALVTFFIGALCYWGQVEAAAVVGVTVAVLLALKVQTHAFARTLDREDVYATLKFAVITVIVLPLLPQQGYGPAPFDVLVPYNVWLMVVFISAISFLGYVMIKVVGPRRGVGLTGVLGGLASSTAVTLSFAQRSHTAPSLARPFVLAIVLSWTIMFARMLIEVAALNRVLLAIVWKPVLAAMAVGAGYCVYLYRLQGAQQQEEPDTFSNPFALRPAITFGLLYAVILVVANAAKTSLGDTGVYLSSFVSGLADVDAITLSMARLSGGGQVDPTLAARAIMLAAAANTLVKGGIVLATGDRALRPHILPATLLIIATTLTVAFLL